MSPKPSPRHPSTASMTSTTLHIAGLRRRHELLGDRFFPPPFQRRRVHDTLGTGELLAGQHLPNSWIVTVVGS